MSNVQNCQMACDEPDANISNTYLLGLGSYFTCNTFTRVLPEGNTTKSYVIVHHLSGFLLGLWFCTGSYSDRVSGSTQTSVLFV